MSTVKSESPFPSSALSQQPSPAASSAARTAASRAKRREKPVQAEFCFVSLDYLGISRSNGGEAGGEIIATALEPRWIGLHIPRVLEVRAALFLGTLIGPIIPVFGATLFAAALAVFFGLNLLEAARRGQIRHGPFKYSRISAPGTFWFLTCTYSVLAIFCSGVVAIVLLKALT
jgi:hypothetical protein